MMRLQRTGNLVIGALRRSASSHGGDEVRVLAGAEEVERRAGGAGQEGGVGGEG
jgi:hypothetical protein